MIVLRLVFYLGVLLLVLILAWYTTRMLGNGVKGRQQSGSMKILDRLMVGRDTYLLVVSVGEKILLMGVSPAGIVRLDELETYDAMNPAEIPPDFASVLAKQVKKRFGGEDGNKEMQNEKQNEKQGR